jgi:hypothetical protein
MDASEGAPVELVGIDGDVDAECLRLESLFRDCIEPRVIGLQSKIVPLANGKAAIVLRVPKSWHAPHRYSFKGTKRFYLRNSAGAHEASMDELRSMFSSGVELRDRIEKFRRERVALIGRGEGPIATRSDGRLILHLIPLTAFDAPQPVDLQRVSREIFLPPTSGTGYNPYFNVDGYLTCRAVAENGYAQLFRSGILESVNAGILHPDQKGIMGFHAGNLEREILLGFDGYIRELAKIGIVAPFVCMVTLQEVKGAIVVGERHHHSQIFPLNQNTVFLPNVTIGEFGSQKTRLMALRLLADALWNAGGHSGSPSYSKDGDWNPDRN